MNTFFLLAPPILLSFGIAFGIVYLLLFWRHPYRATPLDGEWWLVSFHGARDRRMKYVSRQGVIEDDGTYWPTGLLSSGTAVACVIMDAQRAARLRATLQEKP